MIYEQLKPTIYRPTIRLSETNIDSFRNVSPNATVTLVHKGLPVALLATCREIHEEAAPLLTELLLEMELSYLHMIYTGEAFSACCSLESSQTEHAAAIEPLISRLGRITAHQRLNRDLAGKPYTINIAIESQHELPLSKEMLNRSMAVWSPLSPSVMTRMAHIQDPGYSASSPRPGHGVRRGPLLFAGAHRDFSNFMFSKIYDTASWRSRLNDFEAL